MAVSLAGAVMSEAASPIVGDHEDPSSMVMKSGVNVRHWVTIM